MNDPVLVPCLVVLRDEFNQLSPHRDLASDGWVGNREHAATPSDHNPDETGNTPYEDADNVDEVHAIDLDDTGPWPGGAQTFDRAVDEVVKRHREGLDDRLQNVIRNGRIASRSWGWTWVEYTGDNRHDKHAHFSARYTSAAENDRRPFGVTARFLPTPAQEDLPVDQSTFDKLMTNWARSSAGRVALAEAVLESDVVPAPGQPADNPTWTVGTSLRKIGEAVGLAPKPAAVKNAATPSTAVPTKK